MDSPGSGKSRALLTSSENMEMKMNNKNLQQKQYHMIIIGTYIIKAMVLLGFFLIICSTIKDTYNTDILYKTETAVNTLVITLMAELFLWIISKTTNSRILIRLGTHICCIVGFLGVTYAIIKKSYDINIIKGKYTTSYMVADIIIIALMMVFITWIYIMIESVKKLYKKKLLELQKQDSIGKQNKSRN